ncbi:MAG: hypothetical protein ABI833_13440 [Acidobacteriota bacterium]
MKLLVWDKKLFLSPGHAGPKLAVSAAKTRCLGILFAVFSCSQTSLEIHFLEITACLLTTIIGSAPMVTSAMPYITGVIVANA